MDIRLVIFYLEHSLALHRDFPIEDERLVVCDRIDRAIERAEQTDSLPWQAYQARRGKRPRISTIEAARRNVAFEQLGGRPPDLPPTPRF